MNPNSIEIELSDNDRVISFHANRQNLINISEYFKILLTKFNLHDKQLIPIKVPNAFVAYDIIIELIENTESNIGNLPVWEHYLEKLKFMDYIGLSTEMIKLIDTTNIVVPKNNFESLIKLYEQLGYNSNLVPLIKNSFQKDHTNILIEPHVAKKLLNVTESKIVYAGYTRSSKLYFINYCDYIDRKVIHTFDKHNDFILFRSCCNWIHNVCMEQYIKSISISPNKKYIALATTYGLIIYNLIDKTHHDTIETNQDIFFIDFDCSSTNIFYRKKKCIGINGSNEVGVYNLETSKEISIVIDNLRCCNSKLSHTGSDLCILSKNLLVMCDNLNRTVVINYALDKIIKILDPYIYLKNNDNTDTVSLFSSSNKKYLGHLIVNYEKKYVQKRDTYTLFVYYIDNKRQDLQYVIEHTGSTPTHIEISNNITVIGDYAGFISIYKYKSGKILLSNKIKSHNSCVTSVAISSNNKMILTTSPDGLLKLWNLKTLNLIDSYYHGCEYVDFISFASEFGLDFDNFLRKSISKKSI
ncbi:WD-repeat family protein [Acanthamoeba polyphaga mimivirus]|uniref:WD-repeat family protein n=1 Tax=Acanthamoeba polyphaga mimivirus Kroon TaxID=3069720 RepID=A0A0G2Y8F7_9VIRU|nr:WD-repeat family protein [Acanthamoeba polyphaga mimivirus]AKI80077.1 WD-repeat family protein [Acanthamoeba polyphaga mimivirus Kroon]